MIGLVSPMSLDVFLNCKCDADGGHVGEVGLIGILVILVLSALPWSSAPPW